MDTCIKDTVTIWPQYGTQNVPIYQIIIPIKYFISVMQCWWKQNCFPFVKVGYRSSVESEHFDQKRKKNWWPIENFTKILVLWGKGTQGHTLGTNRGTFNNFNNGHIWGLFLSPSVCVNSLNLQIPLVSHYLFKY